MMKLELPKIGLRQIKTALSVFICLCLFQLMGRNPIYACIAAILCMQTTLEDSISVGVDRLIGTAIGGLLGLLFSLTKLLYFNTWLYFLLITIGIIAVIYCNILFKKPGSVAISCVVFLIIMVNAESTAAETVVGTAETSFLYALNRIIDTAVGVAVGVAVNIIIRKKIYTAEVITAEEITTGQNEDLYETELSVNTESMDMDRAEERGFSDEDEYEKEN